MMKKQQSGFTLIELIMVIVILGILAAFALPKFADMSGDARYSSISGALGSVRSASAIVHSAALAKSLAADTGDKVILEGTEINLVYGYIAGTVADIQAAAQLSSEFTVTAATGTVTVTLGGCSFTYEQASAADSGVSISDITGATTDKSCPAQ